jgi:acetoin utilization deacetylase AcuC-like enzyme
VTAAVDSVLTGKHRNAFCAVRPPGHHAGPNGLLEAAVSCGFCIFNNVAVGALHALEHHGLQRVAIVDTDVSTSTVVVIISTSSVA